MFYLSHYMLFIFESFKLRTKFQLHIRNYCFLATILKTFTLDELPLSLADQDKSKIVKFLILTMASFTLYRVKYILVLAHRASTRTATQALSRLSSAEFFARYPPHILYIYFVYNA